MVLRALGAGPAMVAADCLLGLLGAVAAGALLAVAVAVAFSPRRADRPGAAGLPGTGGGVRLDRPRRRVPAAGLRFRRGRGCPGGTCGRPADAAWPARPAVPARGSAAGRLAVASGLPPAAVAGFQFAFDSGAGRGRRAVPARSALSAAVLAVVIVMTTLTFGASLSALVSRPAALRLELVLRPGLEPGA